MSIKTTQTVSRRWAIERIQNIYQYVLDKNFIAVANSTFEPDNNLTLFVCETEIHLIGHIDKWTNEMIEEILDMPFFRKSMFDNYFVVNEIDND